MRAACRVEPGSHAKLTDRPTDAKLGLDRATVETEAAHLTERLSELHNRLWAEHARSVLLVLQGLDASGKDGTIRRVFTGLNPPRLSKCTRSRCRATDELDHDFLWRVHHVLPARGEIGIFNRSHYEDIDDCGRPRRHRRASERKRRCDHVNAVRADADRRGHHVLKVFLHVGKDEQRERLQARLDDPRSGGSSAARISTRVRNGTRT